VDVSNGAAPGKIFARRQIGLSGMQMLLLELVH
jgi:hypothetical protein